MSSIFVGLLLLNTINSQEFINDDVLKSDQELIKSKGFINSLSIQLFNTVGYDDLEASFWSSVGSNARHNINLRLSHNRFEGDYFGVGLGYGYELYAGKHMFLPYVTYNQDVQTWNNAALVSALYYANGGRFDFAIGTTTNFSSKLYQNNSVWFNAYYNIRALGGIQIGAEYSIMTDSDDVYYGIILQKTLWTKKK